MYEHATNAGPIYLNLTAFATILYIPWVAAASASWVLLELGLGFWMWGWGWPH